MDETAHRASSEIPLDHPCLPGHFPGHPVVPAVVILEAVLDALRAWRGPQGAIRRLHAVKFLHPLYPGQRFDIVLSLAGLRLDFRCERESRVLAQGRWELGP